MTSKENNFKHRQRYKRRRASGKLRIRIRNMINDFHRKLCKWLCENYRVIIIPKFQSSNMVRKTRRKIGRKTARNLLTWGHYRFRQMLIDKAREYPWVNKYLCHQ